MSRLLVAFLVVLCAAPATCAQSRSQAARILARTGQLPVYVERSEEELPPPAPYVKLPSDMPDHLMARRQELKARKAAQKQRMLEVQAARAELEERRYQDWHQRYLADTPVREEYYRALASAYDADRALAYQRGAYLNLEAAVIWNSGLPFYYQPWTIYQPFYWDPGVVYFSFSW